MINQCFRWFPFPDLVWPLSTHPRISDERPENKMCLKEFVTKLCVLGRFCNNRRIKDEEETILYVLSEQSDYKHIGVLECVFIV